ncbi:related to histone deacetylase [Sporisorium reilianum SRZ2]|uniref:Related to histone deacetylase n=1 Tax=Sporisorium reilianum (strain SRZ2) TaxID=999809 RepID=E6ZNI8_SPORE|nr:related to histone deacetylase [Sporisorium reilianum SRZ2]
MSVVTKPPRVAYVVSDELIKYADLLPSNQGRSSLVHSLAYQLDLLDLSGLDEHDKGIGTSSAASQKAKLLRAVGSDAANESSTDSPRRRAVVYLPHAASHQQLTSYHQDSFVRQLAKGADAGKLEQPHSTGNTAKRRKLNGVSSDSESDASDSSSHASASSEELHLRPSSSVSGPPRQRGYKRSRPAKNQFGLQDDCPAFDGLQQHVSLVAGAAITAAELLATGQADMAIAWDGGRHHAKKDSASGFCYINDVVLAILSLRKPRKVTVTTTAPRSQPDGEDGDEEMMRKTTIKRVDRVMYLDLDLHWGDGVEEAFYSSANVLTLSIHHYAPGFFPCYAASSDPHRFSPPGSLGSDAGTGRKTLNIPLGIGTSDASLERVMESTVQPLVDAWDPEMVVVQCGVDGLAGDPMAVWNLSVAAYVRAIQRVLGWKKPTLLLGGGGYCSENAARCWSLLTAVCLGRFADRDHSKRSSGAGKPRQGQPLPLTEQKESTENDQGAKTEEASPSSLDTISYDTPIPEHKFWPNYAPAYSLDVAAGEMIDQNDEAHFEAISKTFTEHIQKAASGSR